jgi:hypothetical protein
VEQKKEKNRELSVWTLRREAGGSRIGKHKRVFHSSRGKQQREAAALERQQTGQNKKEIFFEDLRILSSFSWLLVGEDAHLG